MILVLQMLFTANLMGLSWFIQVVHYLLFKEVPFDAFKKYSLLHQKKTTLVVAPLIIGEMVTGIWLFMISEISLIIVVLSILLILIWIVTIGFAVPIHKKLFTKKQMGILKSWLHFTG
jgi:hypothetical protein